MHRRLTALVLVVCACSDPVHDEAVAALGPETAGVPRGPYHRPRQPCLTCHGGDGPASLTMSFGGTVQAHQSGAIPASGAAVRVVDSSGGTYETEANCVGNFWIRSGDFVPVFPVSSAVTSGNRSRVMLTEMHRDGSCNSCHSPQVGPASPGPLWVLPPDGPPPVQVCSQGEMPGQAGTVPACPIKSATLPGVTPSYANDVAPLLAKRCTGCHAADGEASDRPFTTRADILGAISGTMVNLVYACKMPPPPLPRLTDAEQSILVGYVEAGEPDN